jgi:hypothetical protein
MVDGKSKRVGLHSVVIRKQSIYMVDGIYANQLSLTCNKRFSINSSPFSSELALNDYALKAMYYYRDKI